MRTSSCWELFTSSGAVGASAGPPAPEAEDFFGNASEKDPNSFIKFGGMIDAQDEKFP